MCWPLWIALTNLPACRNSCSKTHAGMAQGGLEFLLRRCRDVPDQDLRLRVVAVLGVRVGFERSLEMIQDRARQRLLPKRAARTEGLAPRGRVHAAQAPLDQGFERGVRIDTDSRRHTFVLPMNGFAP